MTRREQQQARMMWECSIPWQDIRQTFRATDDQILEALASLMPKCPKLRALATALITTTRNRRNAKNAR